MPDNIGSPNAMPGTLYLVATPIGNLQDISLRAIETLRSVDLIACEDTRHTRNLLNHFRISNKTISYHEHNEQERAEELVDRLMLGDNIAVVSDAGTPGICDPSFRIVERAHEIGAKVVPIPGAVAFVNAVVASGIATDSIYFGGFLPSKKGERRKRLEEVKEIPATITFYETPHRLLKSLADCIDILGDRKAAIGRELTKLHEETITGTLTEIAARYAGQAIKGEIVLVVERAAQKTQTALGSDAAGIAKRVKELEKQGIDPKTALKMAAKESGLSKSEVYRKLKVKK